jgi:outer membrane protein OmpA-like peptidoglycan-associated protein
MMKKHTFTPALLVIAALLGACSSTPKTTSQLDQARSDFRMAQSNPKVATYAPLELKQANEALTKANAAAADNDSNEDIDKLAYLAKQQIALTQEVAKKKAAEADIAASGKQRDEMRLEQRTNEADRAKASAETARGQTAYAERQTMEAQARNAKLEAQLADLQAKKTERGMVITLGDVLFATDQARLKPEGLRTAQKLAQILQQNPTRSVLIEGFTDSTGSAAHNQGLSERRANSVQNSLRHMGIARNRITVHGYGEEYPVAANDTGEERRFNRRVEIVLSDEAGAIPPR